jgi:hypothetical protein
MLQAAIVQHRGAVIFCCENNLLRLACTFVRAMGKALPKEAAFEIHEYPKKRAQGQNTDEYRVVLEDWIDTELTRTEGAISDYVKEFYERGGANRLD